MSVESKKECHFSVIMSWSGQRRAFVVKFLLKSNDSFILAQRTFHKKFNLKRHDPVPSWVTMKKWSVNLGAAGAETNI